MVCVCACLIVPTIFFTYAWLYAVVVLSRNAAKCTIDGMMYHIPFIWSVQTFCSKEQPKAFTVNPFLLLCDQSQVRCTDRKPLIAACHWEERKPNSPSQFAQYFPQNLKYIFSPSSKNDIVQGVVIIPISYYLTVAIKRLSDCKQLKQCDVFLALRVTWLCFEGMVQH